MFQNLKRTAIVLLLLLRLDRPAGEGEIAESLDINVETARTYLRSLAEHGLVVRIGGRYGGYQLTVGGRQMVLPMAPPNLPETTPGNAENPRSQLLENVEIFEKTDHGSSAENPRSSAENPRSSAENPRSSAENPRSHNLEIVVNNNNNIDSLNHEVVVVRARPKRQAAKAKKTPAAQKRAKRAVLVGEGVLPKICEELAARPEITLEHIMAWATVLKGRWQEQYSPGNLVSALRYIRAGDPPPSVPDAHLPASDEAPLPEPAEAPDPPPPATVVGWDGQGMAPGTAWLAALEVTEGEYRDVYRRWLLPTWLGRVENDHYTVICPNGDYAAWLNERFATILSTILTGIRNTPATVKFVAE